MSWLYSRALVAAYSEGICLGGAPSAPSSGTPTQLVFSSHGKMTDFSRRSLSGMTCKPLTDADGEAVLTSFLADFPARTLAPPDEAQELTESDRECGRTWQGSLAKYDPDSRSWKTPQCSLVAGLDVFSATWPQWGMMRDGVSWELKRPAHLTSDIEYGSKPNGETWPTPTAHDAKDTGAPSESRRKSPGLFACAMQKIPTPTVCGNYNRKGASPTSGDGLATWAARSALTDGETPPGLRGGKLSPNWVEWLMGWPPGWTDFAPLGMDRYQLWLDSHGRR